MSESPSDPYNPEDTDTTTPPEGEPVAQGPDREAGVDPASDSDSAES